MNEILVLDEISSTNEFCLDQSDLKHGQAVLAFKQTKGRGQYGRVWDSNIGGLYLTVVLKNPDLNGLTVRIGEAIREFLEDMTGEKFSVKLPNDILYKGKKMCGVLVESRSCGGEVFAVCGVGMDVNNKWQDSYSLSMIMGKTIDVVDLGKKIRDLICNLKK